MTGKTWGIIALTVVLVVFGVIAATAKTTTKTKTGPSSTEVGGVGDSILSAACAALGIKC